jgi:hypothetical protein
MVADSPGNWDPAELLLYAEEYLDQYLLFAFKDTEPHMELAISYLEMARACVEDAQAALAARFANPS